MNNIFNPRCETLEDIITQAQQEQWHTGIQRAMYEYYRAKVIRIALNNHERDETLKLLRVIFGMGAK